MLFQRFLSDVASDITTFTSYVFGCLDDYKALIIYLEAHLTNGVCNERVYIPYDAVERPDPRLIGWSVRKLVGTHRMNSTDLGNSSLTNLAKVYS